MLRKIRIRNYKSIVDDTIELGRINVFIGENGCGKSNLLEAVAMAGAALSEDLDPDDLFHRGIRLAKPSLTSGAFSERDAVLAFGVCLDDEQDITFNDADGAWVSLTMALLGRARAMHSLLSLVAEADRQKILESMVPIVSHLNVSAEERTLPDLISRWASLTADVHDFQIYAPNSLALRGLQNTSRKEPLGIFGEGLDTAIASLSDAEREELTERASCISWLENILIDEGDRLKLQGFKMGRSTSTLYFEDRFMARNNRVFSAENANEGILHVLFYLTLFISKRTPPCFAIDNIETALNPQLCRELIKQLVVLAKKDPGKQALITTHNPAVLDGLNLHDDDQRLFVVSRNEEGHTQTRRITMKPDAPDGQKLKLSELWMRGHLGGLPQGF